LFGDAPVGRLAELWELALAGYVVGLRDAGWSGDPLDMLEATIMAAGRWGCFLASLTCASPWMRKGTPRRNASSAADWLANQAELVRFCLGRAEEARPLAPVLGLTGAP
jgi:hypothetical protein